MARTVSCLSGAALKTFGAVDVDEMIEAEGNTLVVQALLDADGEITRMDCYWDKPPSTPSWPAPCKRVPEALPDADVAQLDAWRGGRQTSKL